ncbi:hypothetical protein TNCV_2218341 [Trichonephila clavipes]|nr:hypothetical protein TNCV_2218341 [Trichonephila clavipes]
MITKSRFVGIRMVLVGPGTPVDPVAVITKRNASILIRIQNWKNHELRKASATRELLVTDHGILNHGQVTWTTLEQLPRRLTTTPHQREDVSALDRLKSVAKSPRVAEQCYGNIDSFTHSLV